MPSPDGKHLAFRAMTLDSNAWMIENFEQRLVPGTLFGSYRSSTQWSTSNAAVKPREELTRAAALKHERCAATPTFAVT
jgi:hypothetical protein